MRLFLLTLFFVGLILVIVNERLYYQPSQVEYRYLPRDLDTYLRNTPNTLMSSRQLMESDSPWFTRANYM